VSVISIFSAAYCSTDQVVGEVVDHLGCRLLDDDSLCQDAARLAGVSADKIQRAFHAKTSVFNKFTHEKERAVAWLKLALAQAMQDDGLLISGFASLLAPRTVTHALRVCLVADTEYRLGEAAKSGVSEKEALRRLREADEDAAAWAEVACGFKDPWDSALYDVVLPMDKKPIAEAGSIIVRSAAREALAVTEASRAAAADFLLAARVEAVLVGEGHTVGVEARNGNITLSINKNVLMLGRLKEELARIAKSVPGVKDVETKVGKDFYQADIYRRADFTLPGKVLLVDDEREFVETLSERLLMRDMGSAVVYDGESALEMIEADEPEVMILDLKMPGIDGIEVLRRVKQTNPAIEVIILTGHGSEADREQCMELGAFAYLQKPVDIDKLSETLKAANEKIHAARKD